jgi:hypothetical protein
MGKHKYIDEWFDVYDPFRHDCICGPAEEFTQIGYEDAKPGEEFLKIGVGTLLKPKEKEYDWFHRYEIANLGERTFEQTDEEARFRHQLISDNYGYDYRKDISLYDGGTFVIRHTLKNLGPKMLTGEVYDHNFFTLDKMKVGPEVSVVFPFRPEGTWRCDYDNVTLDGDGISFLRPLKKSETVYMGDLHPASVKPGSAGPVSNGSGRLYEGYGFEIRNARTGIGIKATCTSGFSHIVLWANCRVVCLEPYIPFSIYPGETFSWEIRYGLL